MRLAKHDLRQAIKSDLQIEFAPQQLTSYSGLELFKRYFRIISLNSRIKQAFREYELGGDYQAVDVILVLIAMWLCGEDRLRHVKWIASDPLVQRLCELSRLPSDRTLSRWLSQFTNDCLQALVSLNSEIVFEKLGEMGVGTITLDFDGTVLSTGNKVKWAFRGYNPHRRYAKSYFPLLCHVAQTGHFLQVKNRPGNIHDSKGGALAVIKDCVAQVRQALPGVRIEVRMDAAFFQEPILRYLNRQNIRFAVKVPMYKWLKLKETINERNYWYHTDEKLAWFKKAIWIESWSFDVEMIFYRQKLSDTPKKGHQLDLFTPDDGLYEYSVICSNKKLEPGSLFNFYNGRCTIEHAISELKGEFAFDSIPTQSYQGNSAYQQISVMAYNLVKNFQIDSTLTNERKSGCSHTNVLEFDSLKTLRLEWINVAGRIVNTDGRKTLKLNNCEPRQALYKKMSRALDRLQPA